MLTLITGILGALLALFFATLAYIQEIESIEKPDVRERIESIIKQLLLAVTVYLAEMIMFLLLIENSEIRSNSHNTYELIKGFLIALFYMYVMYLVGRLYAVMSGFIERFD